MAIQKKEVDPGLFIAVRLATLEQMRASTIIDAVGKIDHFSVEAAMVINSGDRVVTPEGLVED